MAEHGQHDVAAIRERLRSGKLSPQDVEYIDKHLGQGGGGGGNLGEIGGRPIVARLPNGLDVVK
jgi:hypothetical protein